MSATPSQLSPQDFAAKIRSKHPGAYDDMSDADLTKAVLDKYPEYRDMVSSSSPQTKAGAMTPPPSMAGPGVDWLLGTFGPRAEQYKGKGLVKGFLESMGRSGREAAEAERQKGVQIGGTGTAPEIEQALAKLRASKQYQQADPHMRAYYERLTQEEHGSHPADVFIGGALGTTSDIGKGMASPQNIAVAGAAAVAPPLRPLIGAYYAVTGLVEALKPRNEDASDPEYESEADYVERVLLSSSQVAGSLALMKAPHRTPAQERQYRLNKATYAAGGGNTEFDTTLGDIDQTLKQNKTKIKTVGDVQELVKATERRLNQHFERALFPLRGKTILPSQVANALEAKANRPNLQMTPEGRAEANMYRRAAASYRQGWTLEKLDLERRRLFDARMAQKTSVQQSVARRANISADIDQTIEDNIRDLEYSELNTRYPNQNFGNLKLRQAKLVELKDVLERRVDDLKNAQAKEKGAPLLMREHATGSAGKHGLYARVTAKIPGAGPETAANVAAKKAFKRPGVGTALPPLTGGPTPPPAAAAPATPPAGPTPPGAPPAGAAPPATPPATPPAGQMTPPPGQVSVEEALARAQRRRDMAESIPSSKEGQPLSEADQRIEDIASMGGEITPKELGTPRSLESTLKKPVSPAKRPAPKTNESGEPQGSFEDWSKRVQELLTQRGKVLADPSALGRIKRIDWRKMYEEGLVPNHAVNRAVKLATDPTYKPRSAGVPEEGVPPPSFLNADQVARWNRAYEAYKSRLRYNENLGEAERAAEKKRAKEILDKEKESIIAASRKSMTPPPAAKSKEIEF